MELHLMSNNTFALGLVHSSWECGCHTWSLSLAWKTIILCTTICETHTHDKDHAPL